MQVEDLSSPEFLGCDFKCSFCFGIEKGRGRIPNLRLGYKTYKNIGNHKIPLNKIKIGQKIMTLDNNLNLVETEVKNIITREVTEWYDIRIDNKKYLVTPEHPFFTTRGIIAAKDLKVNDYIIECKSNQYISYNAIYNNCMKNKEIALKNAASHDYKKDAEKHKQTIAKKKELGIWNPKGNYVITEETRRKISIANTGERNGNYNPNRIDRNFDNLKKMIKKGLITKSQLSGKTPEEDDAKGLVVHHIDGNHNNDSIDNLIVITSREHNQIHERGYNFWTEDRKDNKKVSLEVIYNHNGKQVQNIKHYDITKQPYYGRSYGPKPLKVMNLSCEPYNTYLADDMLVHNCDSKFTWDNKDIIKYKDEELRDYLIDLCKKTNCYNVILTGGNPCLYDFTKVVEGLNEEGIDTGVETQGSKIPSWLNEVKTLVFSPKGPSSGQKDTYSEICDYITKGEYRKDQVIAIKTPIFNEEDIEFIRKYARFINSFKEIYKDVDLRLYLSVGNTDVSTTESIRDRVLLDYENLINKINENAEDFQNTYILPQIHTLVWGNKQGV